MANRSVLQWDKDDCAAMGLVKFDLLGLGMLSAPALYGGPARRAQGLHVDFAKLDLSSRPSTRCCSAPTRSGVPGRVARADGHLPRLKPRVFYDLVVEVAPDPSRPHPGRVRASTSAAATSWIRWSTNHPSMKPALRKTLGFRCSRNS